MNGLRSLVFTTLKSDVQLNSLGISESSLYPVYSRDSTPEAIEGPRFAILRWGASEVGIGACIPVTLDLWVYDRSPDYGYIMQILKRARTLLDSLINAQTADGWVTGVNWQGGSPDLIDDMYNAYTRNESYRIVASGN